MYYRIQPNVFTRYVYDVQEDPELPWGVTLAHGRLVDREKVPDPLVFPVNCTVQQPPRHFMGMSIPIMSEELVAVLQDAGVDNLELFNAELVNEETGERWTSGWYAVNIIGLISCAVLDRSEHTRIGGRPGGGAPLVHFHNLVIDPDRAGGQYLFRLAESPHTILMHEKVFNAIPDRPEPGWNITAFPVDEV